MHVRETPDSYAVHSVGRLKWQHVSKCCDREDRSPTKGTWSGFCLR